jgi:hypothetical protein
MRNRRAIVFFLAWSLLFAFALAVTWVYRRPPPAIHRTTLSALNAENVSKVEIDRAVNGGEVNERLVLVRMDGRWRLEAPIAAEADEQTVKRIIDAVVFSEPKDTLAAQDMEKLHRSIDDFGLGSPRIAVSLTVDSRRETYSFGRLTASGDEVYVQDDGGLVMTVPTGVVQAIDLPIGGFRRRNLFSFAPGDVAGVGLKDHSKLFSRIAMVGGAWNLVEPMEAPVDRKVAEGLLAAMCSARVISYAAVGEGLGLGLEEKDEGYVLTMRNSVGAIEKAVIGSACGTNEVWALTPEGAVVKLPESLLVECRRYQKDLADRRVFPVEAANVKSFSVLDRYPAYTLSRDDPSAAWKLVSPADAPADAAVAEKLLAILLALNSDDLQKGVAATNALNASMAMESTNVLSVSVATGTTNFPPSRVLRDSVLKGMRLVDLRDKLLIRQPASTVRKVEVLTVTGVKWELKCPNPLPPGAKPHELFAKLEEGVVAESVEAVAPSQDDFRRYGLLRPSYTITFELDDSQSTGKKMLLGAAAPGGGRYASIGGADAVFVLPASTVSTLTKPVE